MIDCQSPDFEPSNSGFWQNNKDLPFKHGLACQGYSLSAEFRVKAIADLSSRTSWGDTNMRFNITMDTNKV
jgi:hypothetical protein